VEGTIVPVTGAVGAPAIAFAAAAVAAARAYAAEARELTCWPAALG